MPKTLNKKDLEAIIKPLPVKDRAKLREQVITEEWLFSSIGQCRRLMKRDLWIGPVWVILYGILLFKTGYSNLTIAVFVIGAVYFVYTVFTTGSYGLNRRRLKVYQELLKKIEGK